jgi:hypothetical protein
MNTLPEYYITILKATGLTDREIDELSKVPNWKEVVKIIVNSEYKPAVNNTFNLYDPDTAEKITEIGRNMLKDLGEFKE